MKILLPLVFVLFIFGCSAEDKKQENTSKKTTKAQSKTSVKQNNLICSVGATKISCKLTVKRVNSEREVEFDWKSPHGKDDREHEINLPANHATVFDVRYKKGRVEGLWHVVVDVGDDTYKTTFKL